MNNFSYTEKNKEELFENGCTFFKFKSKEAKATLEFWQRGIMKVIDKGEGGDRDIQCLNQVTQHWHHISFSRVNELLAKENKISYYQKQIDDYINEINNFFYEKDVKKIPDYPTFQIYNLNDCILPHTDGISPGRNASLLMYLGTFHEGGPPKWYRELGGELVISKPISTEYEEERDTYPPSVQFNCPPISGICALIDFTKNNPIHEVKNMNKLGFTRIVLNTFLHNEQY